MGKTDNSPLPSKSSSQHPISKYLYPLSCGGRERDRKAVTRWKGKPELEKKIKKKNSYGDQCRVISLAPNRQASRKAKTTQTPSKCFPSFLGNRVTKAQVDHHSFPKSGWRAKVSGLTSGCYVMPRNKNARHEQKKRKT